MGNIQLFSGKGLAILAVTALIAAFLGWLFGPRSGIDQPIIISDGSNMYIERMDGGLFTAWGNDNANQPGRLYPNQNWEGLDVTEDNVEKATCSAGATSCSVDITYDHNTPSIHFVYQKGQTPAMTISSDYDTFNTWSGYPSSPMHHPRDGKIKAVSVNGGAPVNYAGHVQVLIHHHN